MTARKGRRSGGRQAKRAARQEDQLQISAYIDRAIPYYNMLSDEALETIEHNADTVLEEIGINFLDTPDALELWRNAGADVDGERVRFPRGLCRQLIQATAPAEEVNSIRVSSTVVPQSASAATVSGDGSFANPPNPPASESTRAHQAGPNTAAP